MKVKTILLVEDNPSDIDLTRRALSKSRRSSQLVVAEDGQEALEYLFCEGRYADRDPGDVPIVILLDLNLPRMHGLEVLRRIRSNPLTRRVPVVILTTSLEEKDLSESYDLHANSYIRKPIDFVQFSQTIASVEQYWADLNEAPPFVR